MTLKKRYLFLAFVIIAAVPLAYFLLFPISPYKPAYQRILGKCTTCEAGSSLAQADFKKGDYFFVECGLPNSDVVLYDSIYLADYNIKTLHGGCGCTSISGVQCYQQTMQELLIKKYGFFPKTVYKKVQAVRQRLLDLKIYMEQG